MRGWLWLLGAGLFVVTIMSLRLYRENLVLRHDLLEAQSAYPTVPTGASSKPRPTPHRPFLPELIASAQPESPPKDGITKESFLARADARKTLQDRLASFIGRSEHETEEAYRNRIVPLLTMALSGPRTYLKALRSYAEEEAQISSAQSTQLDQIFTETQNEAISLINDAISSGTLTPYRINLSGTLEIAGDLGSILQKAESQISQTLRPEQLLTLQATGFELGEYLAITAPWESLQPPPVRPQ